MEIFTKINWSAGCCLSTTVVQFQGFNSPGKRSGETGNPHAPLFPSLLCIYLYCIYIIVYLTDLHEDVTSPNGFLALKTNVAWKPSWNLKLMISKIHTSLFLAGSQAFGFSRFHPSFKEETSEHFVPGFMVAVDHEVGQPEFMSVLLKMIRSSKTREPIYQS